jgi:transposase
MKGFVGIDWASDAHEVCLLAQDGRVVKAKWRVEHNAVAMYALIDTLVSHGQGDSTSIAIGIEAPRGTLVELLVERGFAVYAINPKQVDRFRDRFSPAGAKDDARDAHVIADALRTDPRAFRRIRLDHPLVVRLREWSRLDESLGAEAVGLAHQLRELVYRVTPALLTLCPGADESWLWTLLQRAPTPAAQARLSTARLSQILRDHRIRRISAEQLRAVLTSTPVYTAPGVTDAVADHMRLLIPRLELVVAQRREAERQLERLLDMIETEIPAGDQCEHPDVAIVRSLPGIGTRVAARMLAEASQLLAARAYHALRAVTGIAPVTKQSGRRRLVIMRRACNVRLREAVYHWARVSTQRDPRTRASYAAARQRGHSHARALRGVADRLLRILIALLDRGQLFDPNYASNAVSV